MVKSFSFIQIFVSYSMFLPYKMYRFQSKFGERCYSVSNNYGYLFPVQVHNYNSNQHVDCSPYIAIKVLMDHLAPTKSCREKRKEFKSRRKEK